MQGNIVMNGDDGDAYSDTECETQHEDVRAEIIAVFVQHLRGVITIGAQDVVSHHLVSKHPLAHTQVDDLTIHLQHNSHFSLSS